MKIRTNLLNILSICIVLQGCNTLYNSTVINLEILKPAKVYIAPNYKKAAVRYNNYNLGFNPYFATYMDGYTAYSDSTNTDSIASRIYFESFVNQLKAANFFDSVVQIQSADLLHTELVDTFQNNDYISRDTTFSDSVDNSEQYVKYLARIIEKYPVQKKKVNKQKIIHPKLGLYTPEELYEIADTTEADVLFSIDFYGSLDAINIQRNNYEVSERVYVLTVWNMYDLEKLQLLNFQAKLDTIMWRESDVSQKEAIKKLPPRKDAVFNAADIAGSKFADHLVPHWSAVQRMYYSSGHVELVETDKLVQENRWMEAAQIWKKNVTNKNKKIAAKCKFNMALACEVNGDFDAALDWVVQSFHELGTKNDIHFVNCQQYIQILSQRKLDVKQIDLQYKRTDI